VLGAALIIAIAAYYKYFVTPVPKTRDVEDVPIVAADATLGYKP
jgi:hypothetical protein